MRKHVRAWLAVLAMACAHAGGGTPGPAKPPAGTVEISIVGTSDLHGSLWKLPLLSGYVKALRQARPGRVLLVDGGDMFKGSLESDLSEGAEVVRAYRLMRYDAVAIGNHEFDYGPVGPNVTAQPGEDPQGALKQRAREAKGVFPFLSANLLRQDGRPVDWENVFPSTTVTLPGGIRVGIVGGSTIRTPKTTIAANFAGLKMRPLAEAVVEQATALRKAGVDIVVVAVHAGGKCKRFANPDDLSSCFRDDEVFNMARALPPGLVDVIVAGHTHAAVAHRVSGIPIIQSYSLGRAFGRVDITFDTATRKVVQSRLHRPHLIVLADNYEGQAVTKDERLSAIVDESRRRAADRRKELLGVEVVSALTRSYDGESALGNFVTSMMLELEPRAQIAITNGGGLRADLPPGPLHYGSLYDALPFENRLALIPMSGRQVRELFVKNLTSSHSIFSPAGARVEAHCADGRLVVEVWLEAKGQSAKVRDEDRLLVVTNDFLATGGDGFTILEDFELDDEMPPLRDAIAARLRTRAGQIAAQEWFSSRRMRLPMERPVRCGN